MQSEIKLLEIILDEIRALKTVAIAEGTKISYSLKRDTHEEAERFAEYRAYSTCVELIEKRLKDIKINKVEK